MSEDPKAKPEPGGAIEPVSRAHSLVLPSGRAIEAESSPAADVVRVRAPGGACVVTIHLTAEGPVIRVEGASLEVAAAKRLSLECEDLDIRASGTAKIAAARGAAIEAPSGGIDIRARDDVAIVGERVLLNSDDPPMPLSWEEYEARRRAAEGRPLLPDREREE